MQESYRQIIQNKKKIDQDITKPQLSHRKCKEK